MTQTLQTMLIEPPKEITDFSSLVIKHVPVVTAKKYIITNHYSHAFPACVQCCLGVFYEGWLCGAVVYSCGSGVNLPGQVFYADAGVKREYVWELARLHLKDELMSNAESYVLSKSFSHLRNEHPEVCALIAYSDPNAKHDGLIYRATGWIYTGETTDITNVVIDGEERHPRTLYSLHGTSAIKKLKKILNTDDIYNQPKGKKFRFVYVLRRGRERKRLLKAMKVRKLTFFKIDKIPLTERGHIVHG